MNAAEVVASAGERYRAGDMAGVAALYDPAIRIVQPASLPHGGEHVGLDGMAAMGATFAEHWTRELGPADLRPWGDDAVQVTTQTWTSVATGRSVTIDVVELFRVVDGRIAEIRVFQQDTYVVLDTLR